VSRKIGFGKGQDFLIFVSTLDLRLRALILTMTPAQISEDYQHKPGKWAEVNMNA